MVPDQELVEQVCAGKREVFAQLVDRYKTRVFHTTLRMLRNREDAEEAAQDTFVRAYRGLAKFRRDSSFSTWIYRICYNVCLSYLERRRPLRTRATEVEPDHLPAAERPDQLLESQDFRALLEAAIATLPPHYRSVLLLYHAQHLSYHEIAEILEQPINSVKTHLFRARALLRQRLLATNPAVAEWEGVL